jgi:hypothetical protein
MGRLVEFPLRDGGHVAIEAQDSESSGPVMRGSATETIARAAHSFEDAINVIHPVASALVSKLRNLEQGAEAIDIKFGLKFSAEAGAVIASTSTEANIEIRVTWRRPSGRPSGP